MAFGVERRWIVGMARVAHVDVPTRVKACAGPPERVGNTQSNMSMPRTTALHEIGRRPTPMR